MTDIQSNAAKSDAYLSALMQEVRGIPAANPSMTPGRRSYFKLAGAGAAGLVLGFSATQRRGRGARRSRPVAERLHPHRP